MILTKELLNELQEYVDKHLGTLSFAVNEDMFFSESYIKYVPIVHDEMTDYIKNKKRPSFCKVLLDHIDKAGVNDSEIYKKAGIDRRHFSKIRSNPNYHPRKNTTIALALALELDQKEAEKLMQAAGYTLSESETFDLVITFCIDRKIYDINDVNQALVYFSLKPLTGVIE